MLPVTRKVSIEEIVVFDTYQWSRATTKFIVSQPHWCNVQLPCGQILPSYLAGLIGPERYPVFAKSDSDVN